MRIICYYYSATGNTRRAVDLTRKRLEASGSVMDLAEIRTDMKAATTVDYDAVMIAFPVLSFSPPAFVKRFLRSLPAGGGRRAFVLAVDGGGGRSAASQAAAIIRRRGYDVAACALASYPENWSQAYQPPAPERAARLTERGDAEASLFAEAVVSGKPFSGKPPLGFSALDRIIAFLFGTIGRRFLGKTYYADEDCDACGLCAKKCPVGTILLKKGGQARPFWKANCEDCNACINACPKRAINTSILRGLFLPVLIAAAAWAGIRGYYVLVRPLFPAMSPSLATAIDVAAIVLALILAHALSIGPIDRFLIRFVQRLPGLRKLFSWTFTKNWRRFQARRVRVEADPKRA